MTSTAAPTIVRTTHKFGDYLTNPDRAKLELPKKMTRPWIVNNAYEQEKLKDFLSGDKPVDTRTVQGHIRETKKRKTVGTNRKYLRNINDIIAQDNTNAVNGNKGTKSKTKTYAATNTRDIVKETSERDAMDKVEAETRNDKGKEFQDNDAIMEVKQKELERDIELEQQQMMNLMFNSPTVFTSTFVEQNQNVMLPINQNQLVPVMVNSPTGGYYIVHLPLNPLPPPPPPPACHQPLFFPFSSCSSSTTSSVSPPSSEDGYMDDSTDDLSSLSEAFEENLEISDVESEVEDECPIELDEELNRLVLSIIEED